LQQRKLLGMLNQMIIKLYIQDLQISHYRSKFLWQIIKA
jgi:hypothetical protein